MGTQPIRLSRKERDLLHLISCDPEDKRLLIQEFNELSDYRFTKKLLELYLGGI
jgi:hypothetical protein